MPVPVAFLPALALLWAHARGSGQAAPASGAPARAARHLGPERAVVRAAAPRARDGNLAHALGVPAAPAEPALRGPYTGVSHSANLSSLPVAASMYARRSARVTGPALPVPTLALSTDATGFTSAAVPVMNTSSAT